MAMKLGHGETDLKPLWNLAFSLTVSYRMLSRGKISSLAAVLKMKRRGEEILDGKARWRAFTVILGRGMMATLTIVAAVEAVRSE